MNPVFIFRGYLLPCDKLNEHEKQSSSVKRRYRKKIENSDIHRNECHNHEHCAPVCTLNALLGNIGNNGDRAYRPCKVVKAVSSANDVKKAEIDHSGHCGGIPERAADDVKEVPFLAED